MSKWIVGRSQGTEVPTFGEYVDEPAPLDTLGRPKWDVIEASEAQIEAWRDDIAAYLATVGQLTDWPRLHPVVHYVE